MKEFVTALKYVAMALPAMTFGLVSLAISNIVAAWLNGIARNPEAADKMRINAMIGIVFAEVALFLGIMTVFMIWVG